MSTRPLFSKIPETIRQATRTTTPGLASDLPRLHTSCQATFRPLPNEDLQGKPKRHKINREADVPKNLAFLPRAHTVFHAIHEDSQITMQLPPDGATSGKIILCASTTFEKLLEKHKPMKFMFGFTHDPVFRYRNSKYGYIRGRNSFQQMVVLYSSAESVGPAFLEAVLIDKYGGVLKFLSACFTI